MKRWMSTLLLLAFANVARAGFGDFSSLPTDPRLTAELERIAGEILTEFAPAKLTAGNFSMTLIDLSSGSPSRASFRGDLPFFTASVVKLYFLVVAHDQLARGELEMSSELDRALRDMIVESSNDATSYVLDRITRTTSGEELSGRALRRFTERRREINRYFDRLGYSVSVMLKVWCEGPYGRDKVIMGPNRENRNRITSDQTAALMLDIVTGRAVSRRASDQMLILMRRTVTADGGTDGQVKDFTGEALPAGSRLWSKAGWTSEVRHDVTYVELPNGKKYVLVVCTRWAAQELRLLPEVSRKVVAAFESR